MTEYDGIACRALFKVIAKDTYDRYREWFRQHPEEPWCYWSKDEPIMIKDHDNADLLAKHPEIEDIDDHTTVRVEDGAVIMRDFCPRMRAPLESMLGGKDEYLIESDGYSVLTTRDGYNYKVTVRKEMPA